VFDRQIYHIEHYFSSVLLAQSYFSVNLESFWYETSHTASTWPNNADYNASWTCRMCSSGLLIDTFFFCRP